MGKLSLLAAAAILIAAGCGGTRVESQDSAFVALSAEYFEDLLAMNPEVATALGDHRYDARLNNYTLEGFANNLERERKYSQRLTGIAPDRLNETNAIDHQILKDEIASTIYSLDVLREHEWNPLVYNLGGAIYGLLARDFAPLPERLRSVKERLLQVPIALEAAKANLQNPPRVHTETAILQNQGTISLIRADLDSFLEQAPELKEDLAPAQEAAIEALTAYGTWLESDLLPRSTGEFRLGEEKFRVKLSHALDSDLSMGEILKLAEARLAEAHQQMYDTALPLFKRYFPKATAGQIEDRKGVIKAVLDRLAEDHPTAETIVDKARADLQAASDFVVEQNLVSLPQEPVEIIVMPEFQRGVAVAYCDSPGPLEEDGETFYAISPAPSDWSRERVASYYREYNDYMLKNLTAHEAMPGHYLQLAHANRFEAPTKVRTIFYSGPFVEGWGTYAEQIMVEHGFGGPEVKMQQLKMITRLVINAILDQKIHTAGMTEKEAMDLMMNEGFQEEGEAAGKWRRACLTSAQLSTYFVGNVELNAIRREWEAQHGPISDWRAFHDRMLSYGSPPAKYVRRTMLGGEEE